MQLYYLFQCCVNYYTCCIIMPAICLVEMRGLEPLSSHSFLRYSTITFNELIMFVVKVGQEISKSCPTRCQPTNKCICSIGVLSPVLLCSVPPQATQSTRIETGKSLLLLLIFRKYINPIWNIKGKLTISFVSSPSSQYRFQSYLLPGA